MQFFYLRIFIQLNKCLSIGENIMDVKSVSAPKIKLLNNDGDKKQVPNYRITARKAYDIPRGMTIDHAISYYPNIAKISPEDLFDLQYQDGTKLSDGSKLIRPVILSLGEVDIIPLEQMPGHYAVLRAPMKGEDDVAPKIITEKELLENKTLCSGTIKKSNGGKYTIAFTTRDGKSKLISADKAECLKVLKENLLYI